MTTTRAAVELSDPFLRAHSISPHIYDLGGRFRPMAIRDQMVRARLLVDRAIETGLFVRKKILVIGAGVAGVSVAAHAATYRVFSVIVEQDRQAFQRFSTCASRWVNPTQYDFPAEHWKDKSLRGLPLPYSSGFPSILASRWRDVLEKLKLDSKADTRFGIQFNINAIGPGADSNLVAQIEGMSGYQQFDLAVYCDGPGQENCCIGPYRGLEFFQTDPFERPDLGLDGGVTPRVLISGGGDGALQDFIRVSTGMRSAGELFHALFPQGDDALSARILQLETEAQRNLLWSSSNPAHDHSIYTELEAAYGLLLRDMPLEYWRRLLARYTELAGARLSDKRIVHVAYPCTHFWNCYPLNRFLAILLQSFLKRIDDERFRFLTNVTAVNAEGIGHVCEDPLACHGLGHTVRFKPACCLGEPSVTKPGEETYNVVIVRHGVQPTTSRVPAVRQMLPYQLRL